MDKESIVNILESSHQELFQWFDNHGQDKWNYAPEDKWTAGQHILHLVDSERMLNKALGYPKFLLKYKFGVSNRPSRDYDEVVKRYQERLNENQEKAKAFNKDLRIPELKESARLIETLQILNKKLQYKTRKFKDNQLNILLLPHPLMGRMTLREIIMWSAHHTEHHLQILKEKYQS